MEPELMPDTLTQEFKRHRFTFTRNGLQQLTKLLRHNNFRFSDTLEVTLSLPELMLEFVTEPVDELGLAIELLRSMEKIKRIADGERGIWKYTGHWVRHGGGPPPAINPADYKEEHQPEYWVLEALK